MKPVDLTLTISETLPTFPGSPGPQFISWSELKSDGYNLELLFMSSHTGTHMDAPFHFVSSGAKIHEIPVSRYVGEGTMIRIPKGAGGAITKDDLASFEHKGGKIRAGDSVFFYTGWHKFLRDRRYFTENPGLSAEAARCLASRRVNMVGIDSPSIDCGSNARFSAHKILSRDGILIVENLANLGRIRRARFGFAILPLKLKDATGSPVRAVAF